MVRWKDGDRVRIIARPVTEEDRKKNRYFSHLAGLTGTVQNVYSDSEVAVQVETSSLTPVSADVHHVAVQRMREKFIANTSEEQRKSLTKDELEFNAHYMVLVQQSDLEKA